MRNINLVLIILLYLFDFSVANDNKTEILIVYYCRTGSTELMAKAVAEGAREVKGVSVKIFEVDSARIEDVKSADAIILGCPVYNANTAPKIQKFINKWPFKNSPLKNKVGSAFVTAGGISAGEEIVLTNILQSMLIFGMIVVGGEDWKSAFGASAIVSEKPFTKSINEQFINKAKGLGKRVAKIAVKLKN